jgi:hypothetical protein
MGYLTAILVFLESIILLQFLFLNSCEELKEFSTDTNLRVSFSIKIMQMLTKIFDFIDSDVVLIVFFFIKINLAES